ncbi:MAG TPA: hypothetical protein VKU60_02305 [Chloroflexota bacterium]|nr:hypothetical protein [Chloroflexota bacterium]
MVFFEKRAGLRAEAQLQAVAEGGVNRSIDQQLLVRGQFGACPVPPIQQRLQAQEEQGLGFAACIPAEISGSSVFCLLV